jgi:CRISPR-associated protein Csm5
MKTFDTTALCLTPLSPIHIGCGMDFEPTNYVIDEGVLYHFDPARAVLSDKDRTALMNALGKGGTDALQRVQKFFYDRRKTYAGAATSCISVAHGVAKLYADRIGQIAQYEANGGRVTNQLEIERTAHHPHTGTPYLPGSSLKGSMRTAWLDYLNKGSGKPSEDRGAQDVEKRLLGGSFHTDPFRLVRLADAAGHGVAGKVYFSTNHKKRLVHNKDGVVVDAKGPSTRRESVVAGQYRAFSSEIRFDLLPGQNASDKMPRPDRQIEGFTELAQACNRYYLPRLARECQVLDERRFANPDWLRALNVLLQKLMPQLDAGQLMLLRVGRHSGAESVTLDGIRSIKIMAGKGMQPQYSPDGAKTLWLAAEHENDRSGLLPFGWPLIEPADAPEHPALKAWCEAQPKPDLAAVQAKLAEARAAAQAEALRQQQFAEARAAAELAVTRAAEEKAARLAAMSAEGQKITAFTDACETKTGKDPLNPGSGLYARALGLSKEALAEGSAWSAEDKLALATAFEAWLPKVIDKLDRKDDWKDARKKLKLAALKGEA